MTTTTNDGGPVFPHLHNTCQRAGESEMFPGLSLRDHFAGQALAGLLAGRYSEDMRWNLTEVPQEAYRVADAMLAARAGGAKC